MFENLTDKIPENLFSGISGQPAHIMFAGTFAGCDKLSGTIPKNLFKNINGTAKDNMYYATFAMCKKLSGDLTPEFFGTITPAIDIKHFEEQFIAYDTYITFNQQQPNYPTQNNQ